MRQGHSFKCDSDASQQILASLNHPDITRLLDAGITDTGQPYLVMEYVNGIDLSSYCDEQKLTVPQRIGLFLQICDAVSYAHRNLTVHLDLKPSNILVTPEGTVKLLDFGTAKLIDPDHGLTTTVMATPAYASPEQLRGQAVTTSCDVYALGAILYELLSGQRPFHSASVAMVVDRALHEQEPSPVTTAVTAEGAEVRGTSAIRLRQMLQGDLATIVARCLRSRPPERYSSVEALSDDLQRYCDGRPVLARKQTTLYSVAKFVRRNRIAVTGSAVAMAIVLGSVVYAGVRQHQALQEGERAERMQNFLQSLLHIANTNYMGKQEVTIPDFLQLGLKVLPEFIQRPADQRLAKLSLAESIFDNSDFQHALPVLQQIMQEAKAAGDLPTEVEAEAFAGMAAHQIGQMELASQLLQHAFSLRNEKGVSLAQRIWIVSFYVSDRYNGGIRPPEDLLLMKKLVEQGMKSGGVSDREIAWAFENMAIMHVSSGDLAGAEHEVNTALSIFQRQPYTLCDQADAAEILGEISDNRGQPEEALQRYRIAYQEEVRCRGTTDVNSLEIEAEVGGALIELGRGDEAVKMLEPAVLTWRSSAPENVQFGRTLMNLSRAYILQGRFDDAVGSALEALGKQTGKVKPVSSTMAATYEVLAKALDGQHHGSQALQAAAKCEAIYAALPVLSPIARLHRASNQEELLQLHQRLHS